MSDAMAMITRCMAHQVAGGRLWPWRTIGMDERLLIVADAGRVDLFAMPWLKLVEESPEAVVRYLAERESPPDP